MRRFIDLSHPVEPGMLMYPGLPAPVITDHLSRADSRAHYAEGTEFHIARVAMVGNTGTYIDTPFHRFETGDDLAALDLSALAELPGILIRAGDRGRRLDADLFERVDVAGHAVLVHTGWARHWPTEAYLQGHPFLTERAAEVLRDAGAALVGIDSFNIDDTADGRRPVHTTLLGAGIPIVEHLHGLEALPESGFRFSAVPAPVRAMGSFPVRAYASVGG